MSCAVWLSQIKELKMLKCHISGTNTISVKKKCAICREHYRYNSFNQNDIPDLIFLDDNDDIEPALKLELFVKNRNGERSELATFFAIWNYVWKSMKVSKSWNWMDLKIKLRIRLFGFHTVGQSRFQSTFLKILRPREKKTSHLKLFGPKRSFKPRTWLPKKKNILRGR